MNDFDKVIDSMGSFGPFQRPVFIISSLTDIVAGWVMLLPIFIGATPDWWCESFNEPHSNFSNQSSSYGILTHANKDEFFKKCSLNGSRCERVVYDSSFTSVVTQFDLICEHSYVSDLITTIQMIGLFIGAAVFGQLGDIIGRKKVLCITYILLLLSNAVSGVANSWQLYAFIRLVAGASIAGLLLVNFLLPVEYVGRQYRTLCGCVGTWALGVATLPVFAYLIRNWSYLCLAISCAGIPLLVALWFVPESCRWLVTKGRYEEAELILKQMAMQNKKPLPDMLLLRSFAQTEKEIRDQERNFTYWHLFQTPKSAVITLICMYSWFASSSVYYGLSFNLPNLSGNIYFNVFISGIVEIPALIYVLAVNNRIGRRWTVFSLFLTGGCALISVMGIDLVGENLDVPTLVMASIGKSAISGGWAAVMIFSAEKFPTLIRNIGIAACSVASRVGGIVAPQLVLLNVFAKPLPYVVFGIISTLCAIGCAFLSETAQMPLPDKLVSKSSEKHRADEPPADNSSDKLMTDKTLNKNLSLSNLSKQLTEEEQLSAMP